LFFERLRQGDVAAVKRLVGDERRSFGWDFSMGDAGTNAESAFSRFAEFIERT
jgi:hypothetical protein